MRDEESALENRRREMERAEQKLKEEVRDETFKIFDGATQSKNYFVVVEHAASAFVCTTKHFFSKISRSNEVERARFPLFQDKTAEAVQ